MDNEAELTSGYKATALQFAGGFMKHALRESFGTGYRREVCVWCVCVWGGVCAWAHEHMSAGAQGSGCQGNPLEVGVVDSSKPPDTDG